ncbi:Allantoate deiminase-like protein [Drosera capensis]
MAAVRFRFSVQPPVRFLLVVVAIVSSISSSHFLSVGSQEAENERSYLFQEILRDEAVSRLNELGKVSDVDGYLERTFLSPASITAGNIFQRWMEEAGLTTWIDNMGNIHGRVDGMNPSAPALLLGSHLVILLPPLLTLPSFVHLPPSKRLTYLALFNKDTVVDAGNFDGALGVISAISALKVLKFTEKLGRLKRPVEVIAFSDEEGIRFQSTFLGSAALAGKLQPSALNITDKSGRSLREILRQSSIDTTEESLIQMKYEPKSVWGYVEIHIEQGPVLESVGLPLGLVKGIAGQTRLKVTVAGSQGHAGTVPMSMRRDPMAAAAELMFLLESLCRRPGDYLPSYEERSASMIDSLSSSLVCTVGEISCWPSASNVIPGQARLLVAFTIDLRTIDDMGREAVLHELSSRMYDICDKRSVSCMIERKHDANAVMCDPDLSSDLKSAARTAFKKMAGKVEIEVPMLMSGAGHDAMAMAHLTPVGMLFVRCRGGISHSPEEHVLDDDVGAAGLAILSFLETLM